MLCCRGLLGALVRDSGAGGVALTPLLSWGKFVACLRLFGLWSAARIAAVVSGCAPPLSGRPVFATAPPIEKQKRRSSPHSTAQTEPARRGCRRPDREGGR